MTDSFDPAALLLDPKMETSPGFTRRVLLGMFIVGQLVFLVSTNVLGLIQDFQEEMPDSTKAPLARLAPDWPAQKGHTYELFAGVLRVNRAWEQITGQYQRWSLFSSIGRECVFPALEFIWEEDPRSAPVLGRGGGWLLSQEPYALLGVAQAIQVREELPATRMVLSDNEPAAPDQFLRLGLYRIRKIESAVVVYLAPWEGDTEADQISRYKRRIEKLVWQYQTLLLGYMKFRLKEWETRNPGLPRPKQIVLHMRRYHILEAKDHPEFWTGPHEAAVARWQPHIRWVQQYEVEYRDLDTNTYKTYQKR